MLFATLALLLQQGYFSTSVALAGDEEDPIPLFEDTTNFAGLQLTHRGNAKVAGQAWGDYNNDGYLDLYVTDTEGLNVLYRNNGDGTFTDR